MASPAAAQARLGALAHALAQQAERDADVADVEGRAMRSFRTQAQVVALIEAGATVYGPLGWTEETLNVAFHALASKNEQPAALHHTHERHVIRERARLAHVGIDAPEAQGYVIPVPQPRLGSDAKLISPVDDGEEDSD